MRILPILLCWVFLNLCYSCNPSTESMDLAEEEKEEEQEIEITVPEGFEIEELYHPSARSQGTWVSLAEGTNGSFFACDQRGPIYQFKIPAKGQVIDSTQVDSLDLGIGYAHGMLWAFDRLYVAVNKNWEEEGEWEGPGIERGSGFYQITDSDQNGTLDQVEMLLKLEGAGEHGPHSIIVGPNGDDLYFIAGNHTTIPEELIQNSRLPATWGEDNLFPPYLDARGHATQIEAPGGWIARTDPEGETWELISAGFRNPFDIAFNEEGELFTFDSDMEWDLGMPWYRPIRVCHATSGSHFGWRTGSGKWPTYHPDNLPAVVNLGQGSPTAVLMGTNLNFPTNYKDDLFVFDWSFGTIYNVELKEQGSSYSGEVEEFLSGIPLPLTDAVAGSDGALYFATGGRDLASHFYRLSYTGELSGPAQLTASSDGKKLRAIRKSLEAYHNTVSEEAVPLAWSNLNHEDRFIQYAARIVLEHQPVDQWLDHFYREKDADRIIQASIALARGVDSTFQANILDKLNEIDPANLSKSQKLNLLRAYSLLCIRMGRPIAEQQQTIINKWKPFFPSEDYALNRETSQLLIFLQDEGAVAQCLALLEKHSAENTITHPELLSTEVSNRSENYGPIIQEVLENMLPTEATFYCTLLSHAEVGWTNELREKYFQWFYTIMGSKGGLSFKAFMENIRKKAMSHVPEDQQAYYEELSGIYSPAEDLANLPQPEGPGKEYSAIDVYTILRENLKEYKGKIKDGKRIYQAALCETCHRFRGEGGSIGPDLTQIHTRFKRNELVDATFGPNDVISDQYAFTLFHLPEDKKTAGRILAETADSLTIMPNPYTASYTVRLAKSDILKQEVSPVSPMPPGLLNRLNDQEITDLFAYLMSGGDRRHVYYGGKRGKR